MRRIHHHYTVLSHPGVNRQDYMDNTGDELSEARKTLQQIPGIGNSLSIDLADLGYRTVDDLAGEDPEAMYQNLIALRGKHIDRCVLYVFRCAVYFAGNAEHEPELLKWWHWKDNE